MPTIRMGRVARSIPMARPPADSAEPCYWCGKPYTAHGGRESDPASPQAPCRGLSVYYLRRAEGIARTPEAELRGEQTQAKLKEKSKEDRS